MASVEGRIRDGDVRLLPIVARCLGVTDVITCVQFTCANGGIYINFLTQDKGFERTGTALGKALRRLAEVKSRWDPQNVFRTNRNIKPA